MTDLRVDFWSYDATARVWLNVADVDPTAPSSPLSSFQVEPRYNSAGPWSITLPVTMLAEYDADDDIPHLVVTADFRGTRETCLIDAVEERYDDDGLPVYVLSGTTAFSLLGDGVGFPSPSQPVNDQASVRDYDEGPAETLIRDEIAENLVTRLGYDLIVAESEGRGATVTMNSEFTNLLELVTEAAMLGGIGVKVGLVNRAGSNSRADMTVSFYAPTDRTQHHEFSREAQSLLSYSRKWTRATATRAIVQGAKEQNGREVDSVNTTNDRINLKAKQSKIRTGDIVTFTGGTPPAPLVTGVGYHAIAYDKNTISVALTREDAAKGTRIDLTDAGSGTITVTEQTRKLRQYVEESAEVDPFGRVREVLVSGNLDGETTLVQQGKEAVRDGKAQVAVELETTEVPGSRYADPINLGDTVAFESPSGKLRTDIIGAAQVGFTSADGLTVRMIPGNPDATSPERQQAADYRRIKRKANKARED